MSNMYILQGDNLSQKILATALKKKNVSFFWYSDRNANPALCTTPAVLEGALAISPSNWHFLCSLKPELFSLQTQVQYMKLYSTSCLSPSKAQYRASLFFDHQQRPLCHICPLQMLHDLFEKVDPDNAISTDVSNGLYIQSSRRYHEYESKTIELGSARQCLLLLKGSSDDNTAYQFFLWPHIFGLLPMGQGLFCCTWSQSTESKVCPTNLNRILEPLLSDISIKIERIETISEPISISSSHVNRYFSTPQTLKIGEASHLIHPLAGQGLNLTLYDIRAVLEGIDLGLLSELGPYIEKKRYAHNHFLVKFCEKMAKKEAQWWLPTSLQMMERAPSFLRERCLSFMQ